MALAIAENAARQTICNAWVDLLDRAATAADLVIRATGPTVLATLVFADPAYGAATSASPSVAVLTSALSGTASGGSASTPTDVQFRDGDDAIVYTATAGIGSGDVNFDGTITSGQAISIPTLTFSVA
jgi:hypothetical protein